MYEKKPETLYTAICARKDCRNHFGVKTKWHKYCSRNCKQIDWHEKNAQRLKDYMREGIKIGKK